MHRSFCVSAAFASPVALSSLAIPSACQTRTSSTPPVPIHARNVGTTATRSIAQAWRLSQFRTFLPHAAHSAASLLANNPHTVPQTSQHRIMCYSRHPSHVHSSSPGAPSPATTVSEDASPRPQPRLVRMVRCAEKQGFGAVEELELFLKSSHGPSVRTSPRLPAPTPVTPSRGGGAGRPRSRHKHTSRTEYAPVTEFVSVDLRPCPRVMMHPGIREAT